MEKMDYKLLPWANKMLPKCLMPGSDKKKYGASDQVLELYAKGSFKKSEKSFNLADLHTLIDFYKSALPKYEDSSISSFKRQKIIKIFLSFIGKLSNKAICSIGERLMKNWLNKE